MKVSAVEDETEIAPAGNQSRPTDLACYETCFSVDAKTEFWSSKVVVVVDGERMRHRIHETATVGETGRIDRYISIFLVQMRCSNCHEMDKIFIKVLYQIENHLIDVKTRTERGTPITGKQFLVANKRIYIWVCPSIHRSVGQSRVFLQRNSSQKAI